MREALGYLSKSLPYFLIGFFFSLTCLLSLNPQAIATGSQTASQPFDEDRATVALMHCVTVGGDRFYDSQMRFSHCVVRNK